MSIKLEVEQWSHYLETPYRHSRPAAKLSRILQQRLRAFMKAREAKILTEDF